MYRRIHPPPSPFIQNSRWTSQNGRYGFAEAVANTIPDELVSIFSARTRARDTEVIKKLESSKETAPLKTLITPTTDNEEEDVQFDISSGFEIEKSGLEAVSHRRCLKRARDQ